MPLEIGNKSNRAELKTYFARNAIPTEANFAALIDGVINQREDGLAKTAGDPLSIEATSGDRVLNLYQRFDQSTPSWSIGLTTEHGNGTRAGLTFGDEGGRNRLFIDAATGAIGVGTAAPADALDVAGPVRVNSGSNPLRFTGRWTNFPNTATNAAEIANDTNTYKTLMLVGNRSSGTRKVSVWDRLEVNGTLTVTSLMAIGKQTASDPLDVTGMARFNSGSNPLRITDRWTNFPNTATNAAEIANDTNTYKTLMLVGNRSSGTRKVSVWDRLEVNGTLLVTRQQSWQNLSLRNGWVRYATSWPTGGYMKDSLGFVHLRGLIKNGSANAIAFVLPGGYRPKTRTLHTVHSSNAPGVTRPVARVDVNPDGNGIIYTAHTAWVALDGVTFPTF